MAIEEPFTPTEEQQVIIDAIQGPILVMAPVGTGKTRVLAERVANAVSKGLAPNRILCLTFTNRAAQEMASRTRIVHPESAGRLTVKTFHGLCAHILRVEADDLGIPADFVIYDEEDVKDLLGDLVGRRTERRELQELMNAIGDVKERAPADRLRDGIPLGDLYPGSPWQKLAEDYHAALRARHALDFADLVYHTRFAFLAHPAVAKRWAERFDFVQVDEVQDTQLAEYEIVRHLALRTRNLGMIGDFDQTVYEWRHAEPTALIQQLEADFHPKPYPLSYNHRATRVLIAAADGVAGSFEERRTKCVPAAHCPEGDPILVHSASTEVYEADWILERIQALASGKRSFPYSHTAVLTRTNRRAALIYQRLEGKIPCLTVEQFEFFRRQEIKDALAYLRLIQNPNDGGAMRRVLLRPARGIGEATLDAIQKEGVPAGLRLCDLAVGETLRRGDPYAALLDALRGGKVVAFDTETTGLDPSMDEVVELATLTAAKGRVSETHAYLCNRVDVGESERIHGLSNAFLTEHGEPPVGVLQGFLRQAEGAVLVGHNVGFDLRMVRAHARRLGLDVPKSAWADTLDLAHRFAKATDFRLETLAETLDLTHKPAHRATDDVRATWDLLQALAPKIQGSAADRMRTVEKHGKAFGDLARLFDGWREAGAETRPLHLMDRVLEESGLLMYYQKEPNRVANLGELRRIFREHDDLKLDPETSLRVLLEFTALARNPDTYSEADNRLPILTVHQAKGLEFDNVFIAGAVDGDFPSWLSTREGRGEEERRLFYVAMTRARQRLFVSYHRQRNDRQKQPSPFLAAIPRKLIKTG
jgi:DNA helicase-2/ATP-dependent DNA helicase PcrA